MTVSVHRKELMDIAKEIVRRSGGRARLAFKEADTTKAPVKDAAHFIKVDGKRVGRDIEMYGFFGDFLEGWPMTLAEFLAEVLVPVRSLRLKRSYKVAASMLKKMGQELVPAKNLKAWNSLF